jgi:hypothetical protein
MQVRVAQSGKDDEATEILTWRTLEFAQQLLAAGREDLSVIQDDHGDEGLGFLHGIDTSVVEDLHGQFS